MSIENFKKANLVLDSADSYILETQFSKVGDISGRDLVVQITNKGVVENQPDIELVLNWRNTQVGNNGMKDFEPVDRSQGLFKVSFPEEMNNRGRVVATIGINNKGEWTFSRNFTIQIEDNAFKASEPLESDDWATLLAALNRVNNITELTEAELQNFYEQSVENWQLFVKKFSDIIESVDPGGVVLAEIVKARQSKGVAYPTVGDRLDAIDENSQILSNSNRDLGQNALLVNSNKNLAKMKVMARILRTDSTRVFQGAAFDSKGNVYLNEQNDSAGSQLINKYDVETGKLLISRDLKLTNIVWFEGCSLIEDEQTGLIKFILPSDTVGNWFIYDFDNDVKSEPFKLEGEPKYCIDNTGQYFVNIQTQYNKIGDVNDVVVGLNVYDVLSILDSKPTLVKFIPVKDSIVHGANKIQGIQMIDDHIYIGRGTDVQWFRTTVIDSSGVLVNDFNWDKQDLNKLFGFEGKISVESEGFCFIKINGKSIPVMNFLLAGGGDLSYALVGLGLDDGIAINYTAGASMASLTRREQLGSVRGFTFSAGGPPPNESILTKFDRIKEQGTYTFTAAEGNIGLSPNMKTTNGIIIVREVNNGKVTKASVLGTDYDNVIWSCYSVNGTWSKWANAGGMPAHIIPFDFDPLATNSGIYRTGSPINRPSGAGNALIYDIHDSIGYKVITCYDTNNNDQYQRTFLNDGRDSGWKKLSSVSVAKTAYELMTTNAALKTAQSQNAKMAYQIMTLGGKQE